MKELHFIEKSGFQLKSIIKRDTVEEIKGIYFAKQDKIRERLKEFKQVWKEGDEEDIFAELIFCILTPQSKAKFCLSVVNRLLDKNLVLRGDRNKIIKELNGVRFTNKKAKYIIEARKLFTINGKISIKAKIKRFNMAYQGQETFPTNCGRHLLMPKKCNNISLLTDFRFNEGAREWLVKNVKGMGYKEASHFLRNIGFGENLSILDRHILKNLKLSGVIKEIPVSLSRKKYFEIEKKMRKFAERIDIPMTHLDLVLWCKETGEIFK